MREKLKQLRKEKKLSQSEMAQILNVHQTAVSQWEQGRTTPDTQTLIKIADYFQVSADYLLGRNYDLIDTKDAFSLNEKQLIKKYRVLDQHGQKAVNSVLDIEYDRCSTAKEGSEIIQIPYVACSEIGEGGTLERTQKEIDEFMSKLKPDTSGQY